MNDVVGGGFYAIIPAGGAGTRLWPLSRAARPKFLLDLTGAGSTLLQATVDRLRPLTGSGGITVVTGVDHEADVRAQISDVDLVTEPSARQSMAAIGLAAAIMALRYGDVIVGSFAADHVITDDAAFQAAIGQAIQVARAGYLVTIGIRASAPATGFGYIEEGEQLTVDGAPIAGAHAAKQVVAFTEKPDADTAAAYLATGRYRWNAGMFVVRAQVLLGHLQQQKPQLCAKLVEIARAWDTPRRAEVVTQLWPTLEKISIDHALAEPVAAQGWVATVPGDFGWSDVGDFNSIAAVMGGDVVLGDGDLVTALDSPGSVIVAGSRRVVTTVGVPDIVVVDTPDAVMVTTRDQAQRVKDIVDHLRGSWREEVL